MALTAKASSTARPLAQLQWRGFESPGFGPGIPGEKHCIVALWDDTTDGHLPAAGSMGLGVWVPPNFQVTRVDFDVLVVPVGPTNMFISLENDADLQSSAAIAGAPWSTTGLKSGNLIDAGAVNVAKTVQVKTTTFREIALGTTVAGSTAGRIAIWVEGHISFTATQGAVQ